jgi:hypothetical protein
MIVKCWCIIDLELKDCFGNIYEGNFGLAILDKISSPTKFYMIKAEAEAELFRLQMKYSTSDFVLFEGTTFAKQGQVNKSAWYLTNTENFFYTKKYKRGNYARD